MIRRARRKVRCGCAPIYERTDDPMKIVTLCLLSFFALVARSENINLYYNAGSPGCSPPPGSMGLTFAAAPGALYGFNWSPSFDALHPLIPLTAVTEEVATTTKGTNGTCAGPLWAGAFFIPTGGSATFTTGNLPFGSGASKYVGIDPWVWGGGTMTAVLTTSTRTITVADFAGRWGGAIQPFIIATDHKFAYGYRIWNGGCGGTDGIYYAIGTFATNETPLTISGTAQVTDNAACGGGVMGLHGSYEIDSGVRMWDGTAVINIAGDMPTDVFSHVRVRKNGVTMGLKMVPPSHSDASHIRIKTQKGVQAFKKYVP